MRILFVVPYVPSLIRVRPFNLIRQLSARGHHVTVATIYTNDRERQELQDLSRQCADVIAVSLPPWRSLTRCAHALMTNEPLQTRYSWSPDLAARIDRARGQVDVVHIEHLRGVRYGVEPRPMQQQALPPTVWDSVDCITDLFEQALDNRQDRLGRLINRIELSRTRAYEGWATTQFDRVLVTSANDKASLRRLASEARQKGTGERSTRPGQSRPLAADPITVLPNGVDLDYFTPVPSDRETNTLVFSGKLSYHANDTAVRHLLTAVMPEIWARRPGVKLWLVGKDPTADVKNLANQWPDRVVITGTVPDVRPFLRQAAVAVAPLVYGVGCQNKVLEAMACATPVVATPRAVGALTATPGLDVVLADGPHAFSEAVIGLLDNPVRQREIGRAGRAYVEAQHKWDGIAARLESIYEDLLAERHPQRLERVAG